MSEQVNHPSHYGDKDSPYEVIKIAEHYNTDLYIFNLLKYCLRAGVKSKETELQDLEKGLWYLQRKINKLKQKDLTINIKCEDNLSPVLEEMHDKVQDVKKDLLSDLKDFDSSKKEVLDMSNEDIYKTCLKGCAELLSIKCNISLDDSIKEISDHLLNSIKDEPKLIGELKVGDEIKAIKDLYMDGSEDLVDISLVEGRGYSIKAHIGKQIIIKSEYDENHYFPLSDLHEYFHVTK